MSKVVEKFNDLPRLIAQSPQDADRAIRAIAQEGRNIVVLSIQERSAGVTQTRYGPRRVVVAANPGLPPNTDTGALVAGIAVENKGKFRQAIISRAEYSEHLEFGSTRMAARPFMAPMADALEKRIPDFFKDFLK